MSNETKLAEDLVEPKKIWNTAFISLFFVNLTFNMGQNMSNSLTPVYADYMGASTVAVGIVVSAFGLSALAFRFISSPIMDTYNRKYVIILAALIMSTAFLGFSMSRNIQSLIVFRLFQGCGMAFGNACCLAMVSDMIPRDKYGAGIGYFSLAMVISSAIGPSFGLWLVDTVGFPMTFAVNAGFTLLSAVLASRLKFNFKRTKKLVLSLNSIIAKEVLVPSVLLLLVVTGLHFGNSFLILYATTRGVSSIGLYYTVTAVTALATRQPWEADR
jgi:MFS family permease